MTWGEIGRKASGHPAVRYRRHDPPRPLRHPSERSLEKLGL